MMHSTRDADNWTHGMLSHRQVDVMDASLSAQVD